MQSDILNDFRTLLEVHKNSKEELENRSLETVTYFARDIFWKQMKNREEPSESKNTFSKTKGEYINIEKNELHNFAKKYSAKHIHSNSICTWIPKNACSNIRYSIAIANGLISGYSDIEWIHSNNNSLGASNNELLNANYTFSILRNPFKRLLSYYLDKIVHYKNHKEQSVNDTSYNHANILFKSERDPSFQDFVDTLWEKPNLLNNDIHTKKQCDFMVFKKYDDYFAFEEYKETIAKIKAKTGLVIHDVRDVNTIKTTKGLEESDDFKYSQDARIIRELIKDGKKPNPYQMYTADMAKKTAALYLPDILLYYSAVKKGSEELKGWVEKIQ